MIKQFTIIICTLIIHCLHGQNMTTYILCEGNFGSANSSLWAHNFSSNSSSPIHWGENSNPLGDVGQSLTIHDDKLFIIMNNSHTVEIMDLGNIAEYSHTINLPNASPRYMYAENNIGYISSWGLNAIIVMDLSLMELVDTIQVHGLPEHIINYQEYLYVSVPSKSDWSTNDKILKTLSIKNLEYNIIKLIEDKEMRLKLQKLSIENFYLTIKNLRINSKMKFKIDKQ